MAPRVALSRPIVCALVTILTIAASGIVRADDASSLTKQKPTVAPVSKPAPIERRPVAVIELVDEEKSRDVQRLLREELARHEGLKPLIDPTVPSLLTGELLDEDSSTLKVVRLNKEVAEDALARFDLSAAQIKAREGLDQLNNVSPAAAVQPASDLAIVMGQAKLGENLPKEAASWFALVHRLTPNRRLDPARYLPEVVAAFDQATPVGQPPSAVEITGSNGRVFIDGVDVGVPKATYEISPGLHIVQIAGPKRLARGTRSDVGVAKAGGPAISIKIEDADASDVLMIQRARAALARATDPFARATAMKHLVIDEISRVTRVKVSDAIVVLKQNGKFVTQAWRANMPGFDAPIFNTPIDATANVSDQLVWLAPPRSLHPIDDGNELPPAPPAWYEKRWVQASAVSAILVIALSGYLYSLRGGGMHEVDHVLHPGQ